MAEMVEEVRGMIDEQDDLEEWVESKITKAHDYINTVLNYLSGTDADQDSSVPALELPQIDRGTFDRMKNIGRQRANPKLKYKDVVSEADDLDPIDALVKDTAKRAINMIDSGMAKDDDPEHLKVLREVFENILEYDRNEMVDYLKDWEKHIKTGRLRLQVRTIATIFQHS